MAVRQGKQTVETVKAQVAMAQALAKETEAGRKRAEIGQAVGERAKLRITLQWIVGAFGTTSLSAHPPNSAVAHATSTNIRQLVTLLISL